MGVEIWSLVTGRHRPSRPEADCPELRLGQYTWPVLRGARAVRAYVVGTCSQPTFLIDDHVIQGQSEGKDDFLRKFPRRLDRRERG